MQVRSATTHHHQTPENELIALARSKGQVLMAHTLRLIQETLELRGASLDQFVAIVRPHFRNRITNPSGFLISFARNFAQLSRAATAPGHAHKARTSISQCDRCRGQKYVIGTEDLEPCPACSTAEMREQWAVKLAQRNRLKQNK